MSCSFMSPMSFAKRGSVQLQTLSEKPSLSLQHEDCPKNSLVINLLFSRSLMISDVEIIEQEGTVLNAQLKS